MLQDALRKTAGRLSTLEEARATEASRIGLSANLTLYVRSDGNDNNHGQTNDAAGAFATIQAAVNAACFRFDPGLLTITIQVQNGTWTLPATLVLRRHLANGEIILRGDTTTPGNCTLQLDGTVIQAASEFSLWRIEGFHLQRQTAGDRNLIEAARSTLVVGRMSFGNNGNGNAIVAAASSQVYATGATFDVLVGGFSLARSIEHSILRLNGSTFVFPGGGAAYAGATVTAANHGSVYLGGNTFTNGALVTGTRYVSSEQAHIATGGGGANYIPGNAAGATANGGIYT